jgi:hypothetical protein
MREVNMKRFLSIAFFIILIPIIAFGTVSSSTSRVSYDCNGSTVDFAFTFGVGATDEISVILTDSGGSETTLTETTNYTVSCTNMDCESGGTVTTVSTYASGNTITILRDVPITQESYFTEGQATLYETFEDGLDKQIRISQQQQEEINRSLKIKKSESPSTYSVELASPEASKIIGWNAAGTALTNYSTTVTYSSRWTTLYDDYSNDLDAAITAIGSTETTILIERNATVSDDVTCPSNVYFEFINGAILSIDSGKTLTVYSPAHIKAGPAQQIKSGDGKLAFTVGGTVYPEWWGVIGDGSTDNTVSMLACVTDINGAGAVFISDGIYILSSVSLPDNTRFLGLSEETAIFKHKATTLDSMFTVAAGGSAFFDNIQFDGNKENNTISTTVTENHCVYGASAVNFAFRNCIFRNTVRSGVRMTITEQGLFENCRFYDGAEHGGVLGNDTLFININGAAAGSKTNVSISNCRFENSAPSADGYSPGGIQVSGKLSSLNINGNYFKYIGQTVAGNHTGCIDLYTWADESIVTNNKFYDREYVALKIQNSGSVVCTGNVVATTASTTSLYAAVISLSTRPTANEDRDTQDNVIFANNILDGSSGDLLQIDATDPDSAANITHGWRNVLVDNNLLLNPGESAFYGTYCDGWFTFSNNIIRNVPAGYKAFDLINIADYAGAARAGPIKIINNTIEGATGQSAIYLYGGAACAGADIDVIGNYISGSDLTNYHVKADAEVGFEFTLLRVINNIFRGTGRRVDAANVNDYQAIGNIDFSSGIDLLTNTGAYYESCNSWGETITTLANDATPSIAIGNTFLTGGTTTITDFDDGYIGKKILILSGHAITITHGTNIFLDGAANFVMASGDTLSLIQRADGKWYETGRGNNS